MSALFKFFLYPFLFIVAICITLVGLLHIFICQPFFFLGAPLLDGILVLVITFHGWYLHYPTKGHCFLQIWGALWAILLIILAFLEVFCPSQGAAIDGYGSVCYGLHYRTDGIVDVCNGNWETLKIRILKILTLKENEGAQLISGSLAVLGIVQLMCTVAAAWHSAIEAHVRIRGHHVQIPLGIGIVVFGIFHTVYCCTYFYVGFPICTGLFVIVQAILTWKMKIGNNFVRVINIVGAGLGMALTAINAFGLFCWFDGLSNRSTYAFRQHCQLNSDTYGYCEKNMEFSWAYISWPPHLFEAELRNVQFVSYASLLITGLSQLVISLHSLFWKI